MKRDQSNKQGKTSKASNHSELRNEEFEWLGEIHAVLSPYWSARSGYRDGDSRDSTDTSSDTNT